MREIEFRGKTKNSGRWAYGDLITQKYNSRQGIHIYEKNNKLQSGYQFVRIDKKTLGQYIGLKDKNGTKIFEGDIVRNYDGVICIAGFYYFDAVVEDLHNETLIACGKRGNELFWFKGKFEVIGNIYDNPELLEG